MKRAVPDTLYASACQLFARQWITTILVRLMATPLGFNELRRAIPDISLSMLSDRLRELVDVGVVERVVDSGPPLRTTYTLTPAGEGIRPIAAAFTDWHNALSPAEMARLMATGDRRLAADTDPRRPTVKSRYTFRLLGRRWTMSILLRLMSGPHGFNELRRSIPGLTERIMAIRLRELSDAGLIERQETEGGRPVYTLTVSGDRLRPAVQAVATWLESLSDVEMLRLLGPASELPADEAP